jgi:hypothetical protein
MLYGAEVGGNFCLDHVEAKRGSDSSQVESPDWNAGQNLLPRRKGKFLAIVHWWGKVVFDVALLNLKKRF